jgi:hypothetical protein
VTVDNGTFLTISKTSIDAYLLYNGGRDIIKNIKIIDIYADKDFNKAIEDYRVGPNNVKKVPSKENEDNNSYYAPFIWWR